MTPVRRPFLCSIVDLFFSLCVLHQLIASASENLHRPYGLAISDSFLYWTEKDVGKIQRLALNNVSLPIETLRTENRVLFDIKLFDNTSQTGKINNSKVVQQRATSSNIVYVCNEQERISAAQILARICASLCPRGMSVYAARDSNLIRKTTNHAQCQWPN